MSEEGATDILDKYVKLKEEYDALKVQIGALEQTKEELESEYETAKGEIGKLQGLVTKYVVSSEPDKAVNNKEKTLKDLFMEEYNRIEKE